jgi:hypothetical protein
MMLGVFPKDFLFSNLLLMVPFELRRIGEANGRIDAGRLGDLERCSKTKLAKEEVS